MTDTIIGIDLGSSSIKVAAFRVDGTELGNQTRVFPARIGAKGAVEADANEILKLVVSALGDLPDSAKNAGALGITGQIGGAVGIGSSGHPVGLYESYLDERCVAYREACGEAATFRQRILSGIEPYVLPKIARWRAEDPDRFARIAKVTMLPAWLSWRFVAGKMDEVFIDRTSVGLFGGADITKNSWDEDALSSWEVSKSLLPDIVDPQAVIGTIDPDIAAQAGLSADTKIVAGLGDAAAGWLAVGAVKSGDAVNTAGTAEHFAVAADGFWVDEKGVLASVPSVVPGLYHSIGYTAGAGLSQRWFIQEILNSELSAEVFDSLEDAVRKVSDEPSNLLFIPHLGGRVCPTQPEVRGGWIGLNWTHSRGHMYRAILESIPLEFTTYLAALENHPGLGAVKNIMGVGGGTRSAIWNQIKADVCGATYSTFDSGKEGTWGSALVAAAGAGLISDLAAHSVSTRGGTVSYRPDPDRSRHYPRLAACYGEAIESLRATFAGLREIQT